MRNIEPRPDAAIREAGRALVLTQGDRLDLVASGDFAQALGYGSPVVHPVGIADGCDASEIVCVHRLDEPWASWVFARDGNDIVAWSGLTGADMGAFVTMKNALHSVLPEEPNRAVPP